MIGSSTTNVTHTLRSRPKIFTVFMSDCMGHAGTCRCLLRETYDNWLHLLPPKHCCATLLTGRICRSYSGLESSLSWHNSIDVTCNCTSTVYTPTCMHIGHDFQLITQHLQHCQFKIHTQSYACKDNSDMFVSDCMQCAAYVRGQHSSSRWSFTSRLTWEPNRTPLQGGPLHAHLISQTPETCDNNPSGAACSTPLETLSCSRTLTCAPHSTDQDLSTPSASHLEGVVNNHANGESTNAIPGGKGCLDISLHIQPKGFNPYGSHPGRPLVIQKRQAADKCCSHKAMLLERIAVTSGVDIP
jgi:hypothetical protein